MQNLLFLLLATSDIIYLPTIIGLIKMNINFVSVYPSAIDADTIQLAYTMDLDNDSAFNIRLSKIDADLFLASAQIGTVKNSMDVLIQSRKSHRVVLYIRIFKKSISEDIWNAFINQTLANAELKIQGTIVANGKTIPFINSVKLSEVWQD